MTDAKSSSRTVAPSVISQSGMAASDSSLPDACPRCGWQYDADTLAAAERGEVRLDPLPTHLCQP